MNAIVGQVMTRVDRGCVIRVVRTDKANTAPAALLPTPTHAPAVRTSAGYLLVDAYLARDGLLQYSDGETSWWEYRPRTELERAANSWHMTPVTDGHPAEMVDAKSWTTLARGVVMDKPSVTAPDTDGISYLRSRLLITAADLIDTIESGQVELSIGFRGLITPTLDGTAEDGTRCDAVQSAIEGNHVASVDRGRAGPAVRVFLDGASVPSTQWSIHAMTTTTKPPTTPVAPPAPARADAMGAPVEMTAVKAPDGTEQQIPTWLAAELARLQAVEQKVMLQGNAPAPAAAAPPLDAAMAPPIAAPSTPTPAGEPPKEEEDSADSIQTLIRRRSRLERLAALSGIAGEKIDSQDDETLARTLIAAAMPHVKTDGMPMIQLDALVTAVASTPAPTTPARTDASPRAVPNVWNPAQPVNVADAADPAAKAQADFLKQQGY